MQQSVFADTILALSSGALPSGVAVVRLSGPGVRAALCVVAGGVPPPRSAVLRPIRDASGVEIDRGLVIFFDGPRSFTGEDCAELHLHGGKAVVAAAVVALDALPGMRHAEAGEFTRRAFLNGKFDLTAAEGLADLIVAETETQRRLALESASGKQAGLYRGWRARFLHGRAMIEAELDFSDEGDVPGSVAREVWSDLEALADEITDHLKGYRATRIVRDGFRVVIAGAPNAGKSSLINALLRREVAIVTDVPGTTRDVVEAVLDLGGNKVIVSDTAGLRVSDDRVEKIGMERARAAIETADLVLHVVAPEGQRTDLLSGDVPVLVVATKVDLLDAPVDGFDHAVSVVSGEGLSGLVADIESRAGIAVAGGGGLLPSRLRHVGLLEQGAEHVRRALQGSAAGVELRAEELRLAASALGRVVGETDVEDLLGEIFSRFCIGK